MTGKLKLKKKADPVKRAVQKTETIEDFEKVVKDPARTGTPEYIIPGLPKKPPKVDNYSHALKDSKGEYVLTLDGGTFLYVMEMIEAKASHDHKRFNGIPSVERVSRLAIESVRRTYWAHNGGEPKPKKLKLKGGKK